MNSSPASRLGAAVREARLRAELSQRRAAERAGVNLITWRAVEHANRSAQPLTLGRVEQCLGWPEGTAQVILDGGNPPDANELVTDTDDNRLVRIERKLDALSHHLGLNHGAQHGAQ